MRALLVAAVVLAGGAPAAHHGRVAFVSHGRLSLLDGRLRRLPVVAGHTPQAPSFSPDGRWLAYLETATGAPSSELWLARSDGSHARRVASTVAVVGWAADGSLAVTTRTAVLLVGPNGATRTLARASFVQGAVLSPDRTEIAVATVGLPRGRSTLVAYRIADGRKTQWYSLDPRRDRLNGMRQIIIDPAAWSAAGIGFWVYGDGMVHNNDAAPFDLIAVPGARPHLLEKTLSDRVTKAVATARNGHIALVGDHGGGRVAWQDKVVAVCAPPAPCRDVPTAPSSVTGDPAWSPDGRTLAFVRAPNLTSSGWPQPLLRRWYDAHRLWLYDTVTGKTRELPKARGATVPVWSSDGRALFYEAHNALWLLPALDADPIRLASPLFAGDWPAYYGQVAWSRQFAWSSG